MRENVQNQAVSGKPPVTPREMEAAAEVPALRQDLQDVGSAEVSHGRALGRKALQLRDMREGVQEQRHASLPPDGSHKHQKV